MPQRASPMSLGVVRRAAPHGRTSPAAAAAAPLAPCSPRPAPLVGARPGSPSSRGATAPSTVTSASRLRAARLAPVAMAAAVAAAIAAGSRTHQRTEEGERLTVLPPFWLPSFPEGQGAIASRAISSSSSNRSGFGMNWTFVAGGRGYALMRRTRGPGRPRSRIRLASSTPSIFGRRTSAMTSTGCSCSSNDSAVSPSGAC